MNGEEDQAAPLSAEIRDNLLPWLPCVELKSSERRELRDDFKHPSYWGDEWLQCGPNWLQEDMEWQSLLVAWTRGVIMWWSIFDHYTI